MVHFTPAVQQPKLTTNFKGKQPAPSSGKNILHDSPLRYTGYCDDIGAATRVVFCKSKNFFLKHLPAFAYGAVGLYVAADTAMTYSKVKKTEGKEMAKKKAAKQLAFQALSSVVIPFAVVTAAQFLGGKAINKIAPNMKARSKDVTLALTGVGALFALSKPMDKASNFIVDKTVGKALGLDKPEQKIS